MGQTHAIAILTLYYYQNITMSQLSDKLNIERGSTTYIVDKLVDLKLVIREQYVDDRRRAILCLTREGKNYANLLCAKHEIYIFTLISNLDENEQVDFLKSVDKINQIIESISK